MGTEKRARQKANRAAKMAEGELEEANEKREVATKKWGKIAAVVGGVIALIVLINVLRSSDEAPVPEFASTDAQDEPTPVPEIVLLDSVPDDFEPFAGEGALALVAPEARNGAYDSPPPMTGPSLPTTSTAAALPRRIPVVEPQRSEPLHDPRCQSRLRPIDRRP